MRRYLGGTTRLAVVLAAGVAIAACGGGDDEEATDGGSGAAGAAAGTGGAAGAGNAGKGGNAGGAGAAGAAGGAGAAGTGGSAGAGGTAGTAGNGGGGAAGASGTAGAAGAAPVVLPGPSAGSAVALSPDDTVAVVPNRDTGTVTIVALDYGSTPPKLTKVAEVDVGADSEPWQAVVAPTGTEAYVVLRRGQKVVKIEGLKTAAPTKGAEVAVGAEPTGIAITPTGARIWVSNWVDGTVNGIDPATMTVKSTIDLNDALVKTGLLGSVTARPGLSHPRSVAITNDGNTSDDDETMVVTEYYAQRTIPEGPAGSDADVAKKGILYKIKLADKSVTALSLDPLDDIGFKDHKGGTAGCYPNQIQGLNVNGSVAYVVSVCASPEGPIGVFTGPTPACDDDTNCPGQVAGSCVGADPGNAKKGTCSTQCEKDTDCGANGGSCDVATNKCNPNFASVKTTTSPVVHAIDLKTDKQVSATNLNKAFSDLYTTASTPDDATRRYPLVANAIAFVPGTSVGYLSANGTDAVFRAKYDGAGALVEVGSSTQQFINLVPTGIPAASAGRGPVGVAISNLDHGGQKYLLSANDVTRNLTLVDLNTQAVAGGAATPVTVATAPTPAAGTPEDARLRGKRFFNTGLARWSLKGQGWGACQSCHVDGLTDNVTWYFARGPRQSVSLDGTFAKGGAQRVMNWTAIFDEVSDFENNTRGVSGGVGAIVSDDAAPIGPGQRIDLANVDFGGGATKQNHNGLSGSAAKVADPSNPLGQDKASKLNDWAEITAYVKNVRAPRHPSNLDAAKVAAGEELFKGANCQGCHGGDTWTTSTLFYDPTLATSNALKTKTWTPPAGFPVPLLPASTAANQVMRFGGANPANFDQLLCVLRPVGTFQVSDAEVGLTELRADMATPGQGNEIDGKGFNPPALVGMATGAPYLHGGNTRTLESLFSSGFATHYKALSPNFLDDDASGAKREALIQFLLSIDDDKTPIAAPATAGPTGGSFCAAPLSRLL